MKKTIFLMGILLIIGSIGFVCNAEEKPADLPKVLLETNFGNIVIELNPKAAPKTVENFLAYVNDGFYAGTIFHRVIKGFMIQGGGFTKDLQQKPTQKPVINEADNGLKNRRGTVAMARTSDPHSASSQFFVNTVDNAFLDHKEKTVRGWGYCVFGHVVEGMQVVDAIGGQPTTVKGIGRDVPVSPVIIKHASVVKKTGI
jgi:peptidyl-prolyl cis-trans isomerase B (cyclophilin B)